MNKHIVIFFMGREGSSPVVWSLKRHPSIKVPLFEDLDVGNVPGGASESVSARLPHVLREVFQRGAYRHEWFNGVENPRVPDKSYSTVAFKWRAWGNLEAVAEEFASSGAAVFFLTRRDIVNLSLSLYYSFNVLPSLDPNFSGGHLQFKALKLSEVDRGALIADVRNRRFSADCVAFSGMMRQQINGRKYWLDWKKALDACGVSNAVLYYEDFLSNKELFLSRMLAEVSLDFVPAMNDSHSVKINRDDLREQLENAGEIEKNVTIMNMKKEWAEFCANLSL